MSRLVGSSATKAWLLEVQWKHMWGNLLLRLLVLPQSDMGWLNLRALLPKSSTRPTEPSMHAVSTAKTQ